jgi:flagellar hook capping protein FlgD
VSPPSCRFVRVACVLASLMVCWASNALGQWPTDSAVNLPVCTRATAAYPVTCPDGAGGAIIAWQDGSDVGSTYPGDIYVQRVSASGAPLWTLNGVGLTTNVIDDQTAPIIIPDGAGGAIVAWQDGRNYGTTGFDVYAQRVNANGTPLWTPNGAAVCAALGDQTSTSLCSDGAGGAILGWMDLRPGAGASGTYAVRVSSTGSVFPGWTSNGNKMNVGAIGASNPMLAPDGANGAFLVWMDGRVGGVAGLDIYGQHVTGSGTLSPGWPAAGMALAVAANQQWFPVIASDGTGGALFAWQDNRATAAFGADDIYIKRITGAGAPYAGWSGTGTALCVAAGDQNNLQIIPSGVGGAIVSWEDPRFGGAPNAFVHRVTGAGTIAPGWPTDGLLLASVAVSQVPITICDDGSNGVIACWQDLRNGSADIFAQRVTSLGAIGPNWAATGQPVTTAPGVQSLTLTSGLPQWPTVASTGSGGAIVAWTDSRSGGGQVYAQKIERFGRLGDPGPRITSITDVPNDQGGEARVAWSASYLDADPAYEVESYWVWRQMPSSAALVALAHGASVCTDADAALRSAAKGQRVLREIRVGLDAYYWEFVATQPARGFPGYSYVAPAATNAASGPNVYTVFMVEAMSTAGPPVFWDSAPDSGFTVDNVLPSPANGFVAQFIPALAPSGAPRTDASIMGSVALHWSPSQDEDFDSYHLHRGSSVGFVPGPGNFLASKPDTGYVDANVDAIYYYKLLVIDAHGNASEAVTVGPNEIVAVPMGTLPARLWLAPAYPNPAREGDVTLRYDLPRTAHVSLQIFDTRGRLERTLVRGTVEAGQRSAPWDKRDDAGRRVASGLHFYRLSVENQALQGRLILLP